MGSKLWNNLPAHIRDSESVSQFKSQLKIHCSSWRMICHQKCRVLFVFVSCVFIAYYRAFDSLVSHILLVNILGM